MQSKNTIHKQIKEYYGESLETSSEFKTDACCSLDSYQPHAKETLGLIYEKVHREFYGWGAGRDCFVLSKLVGENGKVVGVDITDEPLSVALEHIPYYTSLITQRDVAK